jgi:hypothetical protein
MESGCNSPFVSQPFNHTQTYEWPLSELKTPMPVSEAIRGISLVSAIERRRSKLTHFYDVARRNPEVLAR